MRTPLSLLGAAFGALLAAAPALAQSPIQLRVAGHFTSNSRHTEGIERPFFTGLSQTTGINLNPVYDYNNGGPVFRGYQASNRVSVTLRKIDDTGKVLDALVAAGATDLSGPVFSLADDTAAQALARKAAVQKAEKMAREYAEWSGYTGVRVLRISEGVQSGPPMPMLRTVAMEAAAAPTPVQPGMVGTSVTVSVTYEMTR